jgi:hypothetical protein
MCCHSDTRAKGQNQHADRGDHDDGQAVGRRRGLQAMGSFPEQRTHRHQQQHRIGEGRENRGALPAVGVAVVG